MKTIFFDVDTQIDFLFPAGALYVPGAEHLLPALARLNAYAAGHAYPIVSTVDAHEENDPEFSHWPPHCIAGTLGQRKPSQLLLEKRVVIPGHNDCDVEGVEQIVFEKRKIEFFDHPALLSLIGRLNPGRFVVYGVVTEYCVRCAALALARTGKPVELVVDAIQSLSEEAGRNVLEEFRAAGGACTTLARIDA